MSGTDQPSVVAGSKWYGPADVDRAALAVARRTS
jgi:hypothetical protein